MNTRKNLRLLPGSMIGWFSAGYFTGDMSIDGALMSYAILIIIMPLNDLLRKSCGCQ